MSHDGLRLQKKRCIPEKEIRCVDKRACPSCGARPARFIKNGHRERVFLIIDGEGVSKTTATLARWKCPACKKSFTEYPDFALPYKRYTRQKIIALCERYLKLEWTTYRDAVSDNGMPLFYPEKEPEPSWWKKAGEDEVDPDTDAPALSHTALYRWLTTLASLDCVHPTTSETPLSAGPVSPNKFRSEERRRILEACLRLLRRDPF